MLTSGRDNPHVSTSTPQHVSTVFGAAVGTVQILTQPWNGPADWEEYERFVATDGADVPRAQWQVVPYELGLGVVARF